MLERLLNRLAGKGEAVIRNGDQEIVVLGLSKNKDPIPLCFFHTKTSKKLHLYWGDNLAGDPSRAYAYCGRTCENITIVRNFEDGKGYWKAPNGQRVKWAQEQVPGADFCKGCFYDATI